MYLFAKNPILKIKYETDEELDEIANELLKDIYDEAESRNCGTEDVYIQSVQREDKIWE